MRLLCDRLREISSRFLLARDLLCPAARAASRIFRSTNGGGACKITEYDKSIGSNGQQA
jgi:hypothetical protein